MNAKVAVLSANASASDPRRTGRDASAPSRPAERLRARLNQTLGSGPAWRNPATPCNAAQARTPRHAKRPRHENFTIP